MWRVCFRSGENVVISCIQPPGVSSQYLAQMLSITTELIWCCDHPPHDVWHQTFRHLSVWWLKSNHPPSWQPLVVLQRSSSLLALMTARASGQTNCRHTAAKSRQSPGSSHFDPDPILHCHHHHLLLADPGPVCWCVHTDMDHFLSEITQTQHRRGGMEGVCVLRHTVHKHTPQPFRKAGLAL